MKKTILASIAVFLMFILYSCGPGSIVVTERPAPPVIVRPAAPGGGYVWVEGEWYWSGGRYVYRNGYWSHPRGRRVWHGGEWQHRGNGWYWKKGGWR